MKIYKSTLAQLLQEAKPPFYLSSQKLTIPGKIPMMQFTVELAGRNEQGEMCVLHLSTQAVVSYFDEHCKAAHKQALGWTQELRTRLEALDMEVRDGLVSEQPMVGEIE